MSDLDDLLDAELDDLEDLPEFKPFTPGAHKCKASFSRKEVGGVDSIELSFEHLETMELVDPESEPPKAGDTSNVIFMMNNEFARGNFKRCSGYFKEAMGLNTIRDVLEQVQDIEVLLISGIRVDKENPEKRYLDVKEIAVVA